MKIGKRKLRKGGRSLGGQIAVLIFLGVIGFVMAMPMIYAISTSLKPLSEIWVFPPKFLVKNPTLKNFEDLINLFSGTRVPFSRYVFNTLLVSIVGTGGHVLLASACAYAFAKHEFKGKKVMFNTVVFSLMFSTAVTAIPNFIIMTKLNWIDTYAALIVPVFGTPLGLYLMKQFIEQMIPDTVLEAARIDGAGEWRIYAQIVMPMVKPAWFTLIVLTFPGLWNSGQTNYIFTEDLKTLNYAFSQILAGGVSRAGASAAATVIMMIVPIVIFFFTQANVVETFATSGLKD